MEIGNVVREPDGDGIWIITKVHSDKVEAVSFDAENVTRMHLLEDDANYRECPVCKGRNGDIETCEPCEGSGGFMVKADGWKNAMVLAPNVRRYLEMLFQKYLDIRGEA